MNTSGFSLAFNGKNLLENSKEMSWQRNIYQVTTATDGNGTITASPMSGFPGTTVSLSNTPNSGYDFANYSITGATLTGNQFTLNNNTTAQANFSANVISSIYWYKTEAASIVPNNTTTIPVNAEITDFNYCAVKFQHQGDVSQVWAHDFWLNFNSFSWKVRTHYLAGNYKGVREGETFTALNGYSGNRTVDGRTLRYYTRIAESTNATYKFVLDRSTNICSAFLNNSYLGYGSGAEGTTSLNSIQIASEVYGTVTTKEHYIAGFKNLTDAVAW